MALGRRDIRALGHHGIPESVLRLIDADWLQEGSGSGAITPAAHLVEATSLHVMNPRTSGKGRGVAQKAE